MATPLSASGDEARAAAEEIKRYALHMLEVGAEALRRHAHDDKALIEALGNNQLATLQLLKEVIFLQEVIEGERRRKRRRQGNE